jgi:hypothetical protein
MLHEVRQAVVILRQRGRVLCFPMRLYVAWESGTNLGLIELN